MELILDKQEVLNGEPFIAKVMHAPTGARFIWWLPLDVVSQLSPDSSKVKLFSADSDEKEVNVQVMVFVNGDSTHLSQTVKIEKENFQQPASLPANEIQSLAADQLTLKPVIYSTDSTLNFVVQTTHSYACLNSFILYKTASVSDNSINISFGDLWLPASCERAQVPALSICKTLAYYYPAGIYPISITFNNKVYTGSLNISNDRSTFTFNWPYTEGVIIEPKVLKSE